MDARRDAGHGLPAFDARGVIDAIEYRITMMFVVPATGKLLIEEYKRGGGDLLSGATPHGGDAGWRICGRRCARLACPPIHV